MNRLSRKSSNVSATSSKGAPPKKLKKATSLTQVKKVIEQAKPNSDKNVVQVDSHVPGGAAVYDVVED